MSSNINKIEIAENILGSARQNDHKSLEIMFQQFIGGTEKIEFMEYLGQHGIILKVSHSFVCITEKRIISLKMGSFGEIVYQDAFLEDLNSCVILQPSILELYIISIVLIVGTLGIAILMLPFIIKWYYKFRKCGIVLNIKEGISVYIFVNRNRLTRANVMWRICAQLREERIRILKK